MHHHTSCHCNIRRLSRGIQCSHCESSSLSASKLRKIEDAIVAMGAALSCSVVLIAFFGLGT